MAAVHHHVALAPVDRSLTRPKRIVVLKARFLYGVGDSDAE